jgi:hypothetical protein
MADIANNSNVCYNILILIKVVSCSRKEINMVGKLMGGFIGLIIFMAVLSIAPTLLSDIAKIVWHDTPLVAKVAIIAFAVLVTLVIARVVWWALTGRSTIRRYR